MRLLNEESLYRIEKKMFSSFAYASMSHRYETLLNECLRPHYIYNDASPSKLSCYCSAYNGMSHTKLFLYLLRQQYNVVQLGISK